VYHYFELQTINVMLLGHDYVNRLIHCSHKIHQEQRWYVKTG